MSEKKMMILSGARIIDPARGIDETGDIHIMDGIIVKPGDFNEDEAEIIELAGLVLAPGFIDMHVHLRQPGKSDAETIRTGSMAAAAGGFTTIVPMPNTSPCTDNPGTIQYLKTHAEQDAVVNVLPCAAMTKGLEGREMAGIGGLKAAGAVALSDDGKCVQNHELMRNIVEYSKSFGLPILDHCEDENLVSGGVMHEGYWSVLLGMKGMTSAAEELIVARDVIFSRMSDWKVHIQHISARASVEHVRSARKNGLKVSAEVTPHHIALTDNEIKRFDSNYKMNPPLRSEEDRMALIEGLRDGTITVIATDHAPHGMTAKMMEFDYAPFGIVGLETAVPVCLTELYHKNYLSLPELIAKFTQGPSEVLGIDTIGTLAPGTPADITLLDVEKEHIIDSSNFYSKSRNTPFNGYKAKGRSVAVFVRGKCVFTVLPELTNG